MKIANPNYAYCVGFLAAFLLYQLRWSDLYQALSAATIAFLGFSILINLYMGRKAERIIAWNRLNVLHRPQAKLAGIVVGVLMLWVIDTALGQIPTVHIILVTFTSFYSTYMFSEYLRTSHRRYLVVMLLFLVVGSVLNPYRILIFFSLISYLMVYVHIRQPFRSMARTALLMCLSFGVLFVFGFLGNYLKGDDYRSGEFILAIGQANAAFDSSIGSSEMFWVYLYASSPLANLDLNLAAANHLTPNFYNILPWLSSEFTPDFVSKITLPMLGEYSPEGIQVNSALNVSTVFLKSYLYFGWFGLLVMLGFLAILPAVYLYLIRNSRYFVAGLATLTTIYYFMIFDNIFAFSPLSFQLFYPFLSKLSFLKSLGRRDINSVAIQPQEAR